MEEEHPPLDRVCGVAEVGAKVFGQTRVKALLLCAASRGVATTFSSALWPFWCFTIP